MYIRSFSFSSVYSACITSLWHPYLCSFAAGSKSHEKTIKPATGTPSPKINGEFWELHELPSLFIWMQRVSAVLCTFLSCNPVFRPVRSLLLYQGEGKTKSQKKTWNIATQCLKTTPPALWYSLSKIALAQNRKGLSSSFYCRRQRKGDKVGKQSMLSRWRGQTDYTALWLTLLGACWVSLAGSLPGEMTPHAMAFCSVGWFNVVVSPGHLSVSHTEPRPR